jgi:hypothetical protein
MASGRFFPVQVMHLGPAGTFASFNEATLPLGTAGQVGMVIQDADKCYRLVKFDNGTANVASAANGAAHWKDRSTFTVTSDQTDAESTINGVAGIFLGVLTDSYYGFIQIGGLCSFTTGGSVTKGDLCIGTTTDLTLATQAAVNTLPVVVANADDVSTTGTGYLILGNLL